MANLGEGDLPSGARRFLLENSLSLFFLVIFLAALTGQAIAGHSLFNQDQVAHHEQPIGFWRYLTSSHFGQAVMENWQSEYLQFALFALATVWLVQRGSPESKKLDRAGTESQEDQRLGKHAHPRSPAWARAQGLRRVIYSNSLIIVMALVFVGSWFGQSVTGWSEFNDSQRAHHELPVSWWSFIGSPTFWESTFQNWQSEFLAVGSFVVLTIYLRQRGSPESKPVGTAHDATGLEG